MPKKKLSGRDDQRLLEATATIVDGAGGRLQITNLNKALFYLDLLSLLNEGQTVTGCVYVARKAGPVLDGYQRRIVTALQQLGVATQEDDGLSKPVRLVEGVNCESLSRKEIEWATQLGAWARKLSATKMSNFSHDNPGWRLAYREGRGDGSTINLVLAMQQLVEQDPWVKEAATREEIKACESADEDPGEEW